MTRPGETSRWLLLPLLVGSALRLWHLHRQPLLDDELAAVRAALAQPALELLFSYGKQDYFQLTAALARVLLDRGVPLTEWTFRLPTLSAGIAALWILPRLARPVLGDRAASILAWLLAISPALVVYSRLARAYLPMCLCASIAALELAAASRSGDRGSYLRAGGFAGLAVWLHLTATPFLLGAFGAAALGLGRDRSESARRSQRSFLLAVVLGVAVAAALILPALAALADQIATKTRAASIGAETWLAALHYLTGFAHWPGVAALAGSIGIGLLALRRIDSATTTVLATAVACQFLGVLAASPFGSNFELVLTRYLLVGLPSLLCFAAVGIDALTGRWQTIPRLLAASALAVIAVVTGPLPSIYAGGSSLAHHSQRLRYVHADRRAAMPQPAVVSEPLLRRARTIGWVVPRLASGSFRSLEQIDLALGKRIVLVEIEHRAPRETLSFRNACDLDPRCLRALGVEVIGLTRRDFPYIPERRKNNLVSPAARIALRDRAYADIVARLGAPEYVDSTHALWQLAPHAPAAAIPPAPPTGEATPADERLQAEP